MESLAKKLKSKRETLYQRVARETNSSVWYVAQIAREQRKPKRGKGVKIREVLEKLAS